MVEEKQEGGKIPPPGKIGLKVLPKSLNAQDNAQVKIVGILLIFNCLCLIHVDETIMHP